MWSMWNAPSDLDYYGQSGLDQEPPDEDPDVEPEPPVENQETNDDERDIAF